MNDETREWDDESGGGGPEETIRLRIPPGSELRIKYASFLELPRQEKHRIEREEPESFRNGRHGAVIEGGTEGQDVELPVANLGTAILFHIAGGRLTGSEQIFP